MRYQNLALAGIAALALGACSKPAEDDKPAADVSTAAAALRTEPAAVASAPARVLPAEIPAPVRGRWGLVPADCTSTRGDAKGLVVIDAKTMKFYESLATLQTVKDADDDGLVAQFGFAGEGQTWTLDVALEVEDDGQTLIRKDTGPDALPGPLKYTRCT